jgi:gluconate:H+ symporter, GntP family
LSIAAIILLSAKFKFNTFFVLLIVASIVGFAAGFDGEKVVETLKVGFGSTLKSIGLLIIFGTTLGVLLEKTNATLSLANYILSKTGEGRAQLAVALMGFLIGLPIFCDSGFVVLIGLVMSLVNRLPKWHIALVVTLAACLLSVHCLVPPHPGITAAAGIMKVDIGKAMLLGTFLAIPPAVVAFFWARYIGAKIKLNTTEQHSIAPNVIEQYSVAQLPTPLQAFLPIIIPILLISLKSICLIYKDYIPLSFFPTIKFIGEPMVALFIGILMTYPLVKNKGMRQLNGLFDAALDKSGAILAVTAAGGAFGEVIKALEIGKIFGDTLAASGLGLFIPFALAAIFKTAQGSSTVAVMSTASIIAPLLPSIGINTEGGTLLALMSAGAGSMFFSHTNDSYFWVISKFAHIDTETTLKTHSAVSAIMAIVTFISILFVALFVA